jgi:hypothetical protein
MNFAVFLDESGTNPDSPVTVMGGYVSTMRKWANFERAAVPLLKAHGVDVIHGTKLWASKQTFDGWTKEQKQAFLRDLAKLMKRHVLFGFSVTLDNLAYERIIKTRPVGRPDSEFATCFRVCMLYIRRRGTEHAPSDDEPRSFCEAEFAGLRGPAALRCHQPTTAGMEAGSDAQLPPTNTDNS